MSKKVNKEDLQMSKYEYKTNPIKAIRDKCLNDCCAGSSYEVENCLCPSCPLYPFRFGKNPFRTPRVLSDEHKAKLLYGLEKKKGSISK